jgi:NADH-quinone oxidoreductase subunit E
VTAVTLVSPEALVSIDKAVAKYPLDRKQSAVMAALTIVQDEKGFLSRDAIEFVATYLEMPPIAVWEVATFYGMYNLEKTGRYKITICTNLPCALRGAEEAAEHLKRKLEIGFNQTSADGRFTLKEGECMGACGDAPVCLVNDKQMMSFMTAENLDDMIDGLRNK